MSDFTGEWYTDEIGSEDYRGAYWLPALGITALGFGFDIETGGHVFQLVMTNTRGTLERAFITETGSNGGGDGGGSISNGNIFFGFNITRTFQLKKK